MVICFVYEISPNIIGIQDGYNKNYKKCIEYYEKFDTWWLFLSYEDSDIKVVLAE